MPEDNGVNEAEKISKDSVSSTGKTVGKSLDKTPDKSKSNKETSKLSEKKSKGKKKWIALLIGFGIALLSLLLASLIIVFTITSVVVLNEGNNAANGGSLQQRGTFYPRLEAPEKGKESVNHTGKKVDDYYFNSTNPLEAAGFGMPNCTAYVWSRAYEMLDSTPNLCTRNAQEWYDYNKKYDYYPYGSEPRLGAIAVWSHDNSGHVAVVEKIEGTKVTFSNSAYQSTFFFLLEVDSTVQTNYWDNSSWHFFGFIYVFDEMQYNDGYGGPSQLAAVATREVNEGAHYGGQKYWSWFGFNSRVEWCACFVSYCMNECGLLTEKAGEGHKDAQAATSWYKERGHFLPGGNTPSSGMLIFFDWGGDGLSDHIGIVTDVKNGTVHTAEGNTSDRTAFHEYSVNDSRIYGYATFNTYERSSVSNNTQVPKSEAEFCQMFYRYFSRKGYNKAAICGMLGNIYTECSMSSSVYFKDWISDAGGAPGNSNGICQWYGDNCTRFRRDCPNWNKSLMAQFEYLAGTLDNDGQGSYNTKYYYWCTGTKAALKTVPNTRAGAQDAAYYFMKYYERPNLGFDQSRRWSKAAEYWDMLR